jgi:hypothetical protein
VRLDEQVIGPSPAEVTESLDLEAVPGCDEETSGRK